MSTKHKVFISYHHENDQDYREKLIGMNDRHHIFHDDSVDTGDIDDNLPDESIREKIRDEYLRESTVTILLVGTETKRRKHVDWELYSSMFNGKVNKQSGVLVILLPSVQGGFLYPTHACAFHGSEEREKIYPDIRDWTRRDSRAGYEGKYPYLPDRIIDNLINSNSYISVVPWDRIMVADNLKFLIEVTHRDRQKCQYDLRRSMRRNNS